MNLLIAIILARVKSSDGDAPKRGTLNNSHFSSGIARVFVFVNKMIEERMRDMRSCAMCVAVQREWLMHSELQSACDGAMHSQ